MNVLLAVFCNNYNAQMEEIAQKILDENAEFLKKGLQYVDKDKSGKLLKVSHCALLIQELAKQGYLQLSF